MGDGADIFILDSNGTVIANSDPKNIVGDPYKETELLSKFSDDPSPKDQSFVGKVSKKESLVVYSQISDPESNSRLLNWRIVGTISMSYLNRESDNVKNAIILMIGICFLLAFLLSFIITRSISNPINDLIKLMKKVEQGDLTVCYEVTSNDEIGILGNSFNIMIQNIKKLYFNIASVGKVLESTRLLLDNAGEGFLYFERDLLINADFSFECTRIFNKNIEKCFLPDLLYQDDTVEKAEIESRINISAPSPILIPLKIRLK